MAIIGLSSSTTYYFATKTSDKAPNTSELSNVVSVATISEDATPPSPPTGLAVN